MLKGKKMLQSYHNICMKCKLNFESNDIPNMVDKSELTRRIVMMNFYNLVKQLNSSIREPKKLNQIIQLKYMELINSMDFSFHKY